MNFPPFPHRLVNFVCVLLLFYFFSFSPQVNSEEHDSTVDNTASWSRDIPADILEKIEGHKEVPAESITVWIDPLDATQEYTGSVSLWFGAVI